MNKNKNLIKFYDGVYRKGERKHYTKLLFKQTARALPIDFERVQEAAVMV